MVNINENFSLDINIIEQNDEMIAEPEYYDGNIIVMQKGLIKIFICLLVL